VAADEAAVVPHGHVVDTAEGAGAHVADPCGGNDLATEADLVVLVIGMVDHGQADG